MAEYRGLSGKAYRTQNTPFAGGGEGDVYDIVGMPNVVAKIYKTDKRTTERERKLSVMVANQPSVLDQYAWPKDVLYENNRFVGFIMPRVSGKEKLRNIYVYDKRGGRPWSLYIAIAKNLAAAVHNVHEIHQVIGDLNPENILVSPNTGMVTLVDADSYHIADKNRIYRCMVGMPEFVAPELQGIHFPSAPLPTFTTSSDRFSLAVLIFALLMNGAHPFSCKVISGSSSKFQPIDNMQNGKCAYFPDGRSQNIEIPSYSPEMSSLPENIQQLFKRAFVTGLRNTSQRPSAEEWYHALEQLENNLKTCFQNTSHLYYYGAKECPWCKVNVKMRFVAQSAFNSSSQSGSTTGSGQAPVRASGQVTTFTPGNYKYTPSSSTQPTARKKKKWVVWLALGIVLTVAFYAFSIIRTLKSVDRNSDQLTSNSQPSSIQADASAQYEVALASLQQGNYQDALEQFIRIKDYMDSSLKIAEAEAYLSRSASIGDIVQFGAFEQDNNLSNGKEPIEWFVLSKDGDRVLLVSCYSLNCLPFDKSESEPTWEKCSLRSWLNNEFMNMAFSKEEQNMIPTTTVKAENIPPDNSFQGADTEDKVFLLSIQEANTLFASDSERRCKSTEYADSNTNLKPHQETRWWWLRSSSGDYQAAAVMSDGSVDEQGVYIGWDFYGVRPAIWVEFDLKK